MKFKILAAILAIPSIVYSQDQAYKIIFKQDFEDDTPGLYNKNQWKADWNSPAYENGLDKTYIIETDDGNRVMQLNLPKGSVGPTAGGIQWEAPFKGQTEVYLSYNVMFKPGFNWVMGGKLPGLGGGPAYGSGTPMVWNEGFSSRLMWRYGTNAGKIMFYSYHQGITGNFGDGDPWGPYILQTRDNAWHNITIRLVLNTIDKKKLVTDPQHAGNNDGLMEGFINGVLMTSVTGVCFRNLPSIMIDKMHITSFFGGNSEKFAAARDEWILLDDITLFTYSDTTNLPVGNVPSNPGRVLVLPNYIQEKPELTESDPVQLQKPEGLHVVRKTTNQIDVAWDGTSGGIKQYVIFIDGVRKGYSATPSFSIKGLTTATKYSVSVIATGNKNNDSPMSEAINISTTGPDTEAPSAPTQLIIEGKVNTQLELSWKASEDNTGVAGYVIFVNGVVTSTTMNTHFTLQGLKPDKTYVIAIAAYDAAGNKSERSESITAGIIAHN